MHCRSGTSLICRKQQLYGAAVESDKRLRFRGGNRVKNRTCGHGQYINITDSTNTPLSFPAHGPFASPVVVRGRGTGRNPFLANPVHWCERCVNPIKSPSADPRPPISPIPALSPFPSAALYRCRETSARISSGLPIYCLQIKTSGFRPAAPPVMWLNSIIVKKCDQLKGKKKSAQLCFYDVYIGSGAIHAALNTFVFFFIFLLWVQIHNITAATPLYNGNTGASIHVGVVQCRNDAEDIKWVFKSL